MAKQIQLQNREKEIKVYICPSCKSLEVGYIFKLRNVWGIIPKMQCKVCSYEAMIFPMLVTNEKGLRKIKAKKNKKVKKSRSRKNAIHKKRR